jgi:hypothetical protein
MKMRASVQWARFGSTVASHLRFPEVHDDAIKNDLVHDGRRVPWYLHFSNALQSGEKLGLLRCHG